MGENPDGYGRQWQYEHNRLHEYDYLRGISMMKIASLIQFTLPGVPSVYYGDEIGMQGMKDPFNRECMAWDSPNEELHKWYKRLGEIRRGSKVFANGEFVPFYCNYKTIAYVRDDGNNQILVAINLDDTEADIPVDDSWNNSYTFFGDFVCDGNIHLEPFRYAMYSKIK